MSWEDVLDKAEMEASMEDGFTPVVGYNVRPEYQSENIVLISNKSISHSGIDLCVNVEGESNSVYVLFERNRFENGIDLTTRQITIHYERPDEQGGNSDVVNVVANAGRIRFGWIVPPFAVELAGDLKVMPFAFKGLGTDNQYVMKDLYATFKIHNSMAIEGGIQEPDKTWYERFYAEMDKYVEQVQNIVNSGSDNATRAEQANTQAQQAMETAVAAQDDVKANADIAVMKAGEATTQAQAAEQAKQRTLQSEQAAKESENKAKMYAENAAAVTGVGIATQDVAGIIKGGDNHIAEDGTLTLTKQTIEKTLDNSYSGGIKVNEIGGASEQRTTTGAQLFEFPNGLKSSYGGVEVCSNGDGTLSVKGTSSYAGGIYTLGNSFTGTDVVYSLQAGTYCVSGLPKNLMLFLYKSTSGDNAISVPVKENGTFVLTEDTDFCSVSLRWLVDITFAESNVKIMLNAGTTPLPWEPYTGGKPSPNPEYPQTIKSVVGKNLLDCSGLIERTDNGVTFTPAYDNNGNLLYIEANGTPDAGKSGSYALNESYLSTKGTIFTGCPSGGSDTTYFLNMGGLGNDYGTGLNISDDSEVRWVGICVRNGYTAKNLRFYPMIRPASIVDDTYVPYGLLRVKASGKNLLKKLTNSHASKGIEFTVNGDGSVTVNGTNTEQFFEVISRVKLPKGTYTVSGCPKDGSLEDYRVDLRLDGASVITGTGEYGEGATFTLEEETKLNYCIRLMPGTYSNLVFYPMIVEGSTVFDYEPYQESSITLSTPITLNGIGDVKDRIVRKDGVFDKNKKFAEVVFDGSDDEGWVFRTDTEYVYRALCPNVKNKHMSKNVALCDRYIYDGSANVGMKDKAFKVGWLEGGSLGYIYVCEKSISTLQEFKAQLQANPIKVVYPVEEPTFEPLPTVDQIALNSLVSFDGVTHIIFDSEIDPTSLVEYGTSKVGAMTLEAWNTAENNRIKLEELTTAMLVMNQE